MAKRRNLWMLLAGSAGLALAAAGCGAADGGKGPGRPAGGGPELPAVPVTVETVGRATVRRTLVLSGNIQPDSQVRLFSKVAGRVEELKADTCDEVKKGQVLARIDSAMLQAGLQQAQAARAVAQVVLADAEREWKRAEDLFRQGAANEQIRDRAKAGRDLAERQLAQAEAAVVAAQVSLEEATIRATIEGTVTHRFLDRGDFVNPGQPLFAVQDLRTVKVLASVPQADLPHVMPETTGAVLTVEGVAEKFDARVAKVEPALDPATLSAPIELRVVNRRRAAPAGAPAAAVGACARFWLLVGGMSARVELVIEEHPEAVVLPREAVRSDGQKDFVFVADLSRFEVEYAIALPPGRKPLALADIAVSAPTGATLKVLGLSAPRPLFQAAAPPGQEEKKPAASPPVGQLVTIEVTTPAGSGSAVTPNTEVRIDFADVSGGKVALAKAGLAPDRAGAAPYKPARYLVRRQDVKMGIRSGEQLEILEPRDLAGKCVVVQGVTRVTDGARVQIQAGQGGSKEVAR